ncbi:MAG: hypothetical protein GQ529_00935, partial [Methyloprofundus sp.]|nr:hypothetical protein [Methyloprofundus sp.]
NDSKWVQIHNLSSDQIVTGDLDGNQKEEIIVDFGSPYGIWAMMNNNIGEWVQLHKTSSDQMVTRYLDNNNQKDLLIDFGGGGLWAWKNSAVWCYVPLYFRGTASTYSA